MLVDAKKKILTSVESLPTLPIVYSKLVEELQNPYVSSKSIADIISSDQASALRVLKLANSPIFGFRGKVTSITQAITYLGFNEVKNIVLTLSVIDLFSRQKLLSTFSPSEFWKHCIAVGVISRVIAKYSGFTAYENYFLAGVLHDIGKLIFVESFPHAYSEALEISNKRTMSFLESEQLVLGIDHTEAGEILTEKWKLPLTFQKVIKLHHHGISNDAYENIVAVVHVANIATKLLQLGNSGNTSIDRPNPEVWERLRIPEGFFTITVKKFLADYDNTIGLLLPGDN